MDNVPAITNTGRSRKGYAASIRSATVAAHMEDLVDNPNILDLTEELALISSHVHELLGKLGTNESGSLVKQIRDAWRGLREASVAQDVGQVNVQTQRMEMLLRPSNDDSAVWDDLYRALDAFAKLSKQESSRRVEANKVMAVDDAMGFVLEVIGAVNNNVKDAETLKSIQIEIREAIMKHPEVMREMGGMAF